MNKPNITRTYLLKALQPLHIGTGGYQLERINNKIIRDEANVPIIPGTSLSGASRSYLAMDLGLNCSGTSGCGNDDCPVCLTFGFSRDTDETQEPKIRARKGMVQIYDALLLFFPIATMYGPVWVTSPSRIMDFAIKYFPDNKPSIDEPEENHFIQLGEIGDKIGDKLNLGWLIFHYKDSVDSFKEIIEKLNLNELIKKRIICISDKYFSLIVDENLEKGTSVAIDPATNTAAEGSLFSYEAVPQTSFFYFDVTYNDPRGFMSEDRLKEIIKKTDLEKEIGKNNDDKYMLFLEKMLLKSFRYYKFLGVGGLKTRGFGRMEVWEVK